jgi:hypothetical protein
MCLLSGWKVSAWVRARRDEFIGKEKGLELNGHDRPFLGKPLVRGAGQSLILKQKSDVRMH